ncbi:MAG: SPOR domain-containing protein [Bergeyella sp.]|nr:SPOR domain-containing protein [Bergeyella sp.]
MKARIFIFLLFFSPLPYIFLAQQILKKDSIGGTAYSLSMEKEISDLMKSMEGKCPGILETDPTKGNRPTNTLGSDKSLTNAEICRKNPRILGFKILLTTVKSNQEANQVKANFRRIFPLIKANTDASLRPNYKVLAGSYFSKNSAAQDLKEVKRYFGGATLVRYNIFCDEAK